MKRSRCIVAAVVAASSFALSGTASAVPVTWANWTSANGTTASGTIGGLNVGFTSNLSPAAQTAGGINY